MHRRLPDADLRAAAVFLEPNRTPYDLRWRMLGTDVRVHPLFWLVSAVLGWNWYSAPGGGIGYLLLWVFCCFVSVLLHEFGHVLVGRLFGSDGHIVLYSFGGLAIGSSDLRRRWQRVLVLFGGPGAQLVLAGLLWASFRWGQWYRHVPATWLPHLLVAEFMLLAINIAWPILNLLPIWPLDGGRITRELLEGLLGMRGTTFALGLSLVVSGLLAAHCFLGQGGHRLLPEPVPPGDLYLAMLFAVLAAGSYLTLQEESQKRRNWDDDSPWGR
jgi:Zn-dependent protease